MGSCSGGARALHEAGALQPLVFLLDRSPAEVTGAAAATLGTLAAEPAVRR